MLDGVRGFAVAIVMISHFSNETGVLGVLGMVAVKLALCCFFRFPGF